MAWSATAEKSKHNNLFICIDDDYSFEIGIASLTSFWTVL
jgi:hypothetical protein